jgi:hypothetical protein
MFPLCASRIHFILSGKIVKIIGYIAPQRLTERFSWNIVELEYLYPEIH